MLSSDDPVRVFQDFSTLDLLSGGRAEIMAGRGSFVESFPLFGYDLDDYDALFAEHLDLLLALRERERVTWSGRHRPPLDDAGVYPRPAAGAAAGVDRRRRHPDVGRARGRARAAARARDHRRRPSASRRSSTSTATPPARRPRPSSGNMHPVTKWPPPQVPPRLSGVSPSVAASSNTRVPGHAHRSCVLATDDDSHAKHDATYGGDH